MSGVIRFIFRNEGVSELFFWNCIILCPLFQVECWLWNKWDGSFIWLVLKDCEMEGYNLLACAEWNAELMASTWRGGNDRNTVNSLFRVWWKKNAPEFVTALISHPGFWCSTQTQPSRRSVTEILTFLSPGVHMNFVFLHGLNTRQK